MQQAYLQLAAAPSRSAYANHLSRLRCLYLVHAETSRSLTSAICKSSIFSDSVSGQVIQCMENVEPSVLQFQSRQEDRCSPSVT